MAKETAKERRAREALEAQEAEARWEAEKPLRLLTALARAHDLDLEGRVYHRYDNVMYYAFALDGDDISDTVAELSEHVMGLIESRLDAVAEERARRVRLAEVRRGVIARLTEEEREALGL